MSHAAKRTRTEGRAREPARAIATDNRPETRLSLVYKGTAVREVLDEIQEKGHHGTITDAIATALRMYQQMLRARDAGNRVVVIDRNGGIPLQML
jgi:hypothetical protein